MRLVCCCLCVTTTLALVSVRPGGQALPGAVPMREPKPLPRRDTSPLDPSLEELEGRLRPLRDGTVRIVRRLRGLFRAHRQTVLACGGLLGLAHGGSIAFTVLFIQSFGATGWPLMQGGPHLNPSPDPNPDPEPWPVQGGYTRGSQHSLTRTSYA